MAMKSWHPLFCQVKTIDFYSDVTDVADKMNELILWVVTNVQNLVWTVEIAYKSHEFPLFWSLKQLMWLTNVTNRQ